MELIQDTASKTALNTTNRMPLTLPFKQVDVFTSKPFKGNPVAVINCMSTTDDQIADERLQSIANWTNLSETTFIFKSLNPKCHYKLRIFTPATELPLAGHPMIGTCKAFLEFTGIKDCSKIYCECKLGIVELTVSDSGKISFIAPQTDIEEISQKAIEGYKSSLQVEHIIAPKLLKVGPRWIVYLVADAESCYNANPNFADLLQTSEEFSHTGIILAGPKNGSKTDFEMRAFAPIEGVNEDPVCGSGSLALTRFVQDAYGFRETTKINITQGGRLGRDGHIETCISFKDCGITYSTGGDTVTIITGCITI